MPGPLDVQQRLDGRAVRLDSGCLVWTGTVNSAGYGQISTHGRKSYVHRVAWELVNGPISEGLQLDHLCRVRSCLAVEHLEVVTGAVNTARGESPGARFVRGTCKRGHDLTREGSVYVSPKGHRNCQLCVELRAATKRERALCVACGRRYSVNSTGTLRSHTCIRPDLSTPDEVARLRQVSAA